MPFISAGVVYVPCHPTITHGPGAGTTGRSTGSAGQGGWSKGQEKMVSVAFTQHSEAGHPSKHANLVDEPMVEELVLFEEIEAESIQ